jgi:CheY-like chemotaxis protein
MPAYVIPVANVLNGLTVNPEIRKTVVRFTAPDARILIVDDIMTNLKVAQGLLVPYRAQVDICESGAGALAMVKANHYDLIFMDHMMPGMDGLETTAKIREWEREGGKEKHDAEIPGIPGIPIIALTANAIAGMREMFLSKGFNDYLAKPIEISQLNALMEKWIPQGKHQKAGEVTPLLLSAPAPPAGFIPPPDRKDERVQSPGPSRPGLNQALLFQLKQALDGKHIGTIDLTLDELLMLPLKDNEKSALSDIWDHILAEEFREASALVDALTTG